MITPEEAREKALSFLCEEEKLDRQFIENASLQIEDANTLIKIVKEKNPSKMLEIGTFVGVSSTVLGLCIPEAQIICIDSNLPVEAQNFLCLKQFDIEANKLTNLYFVDKLINYFGIARRYSLNGGFFSCCFPNEEDRQKLKNKSVEIQETKIIGKDVCEKYAPFDVVFLDADHRKVAVTNDLKLLFPYVADNGIIVLHDVGLDFWGQEVRAGVENFLHEYPQCKFEIQGEIGFIHK